MALSIVLAIGDHKATIHIDTPDAPWSRIGRIRKGHIPGVGEIQDNDVGRHAGGYAASVRQPHALSGHRAHTPNSLGVWKHS